MSCRPTDPWFRPSQNSPTPRRRRPDPVYIPTVSTSHPMPIPISVRTGSSAEASAPPPLPPPRLIPTLSRSASPGSGPRVTSISAIVTPSTHSPDDQTDSAVSTPGLSPTSTVVPRLVRSDRLPPTSAVCDRRHSDPDQDHRRAGVPARLASLILPLPGSSVAGSFPSVARQAPASAVFGHFSLSAPSPGPTSAPALAPTLSQPQPPPQSQPQQQQQQQQQQPRRLSGVKRPADGPPDGADCRYDRIPSTSTEFSWGRRSGPLRPPHGSLSSSSPSQRTGSWASFRNLSLVSSARTSLCVSDHRPSIDSVTTGSLSIGPDGRPQSPSQPMGPPIPAYPEPPQSGAYPGPGPASSCPSRSGGGGEYSPRAYVAGPVVQTGVDGPTGQPSTGYGPFPPPSQSPPPPLPPQPLGKRGSGSSEVPTFTGPFFRSGQPSSMSPSYPDAQAASAPAGGYAISTFVPPQSAYHQPAPPASPLTAGYHHYPAPPAPVPYPMGQQPQQPPQPGYLSSFPPPQHPHHPPFSPAGFGVGPEPRSELARVPHTTATIPGYPQPRVVFICECCPKKPRKFDTYEEVECHTNEKQYQCLYCTNRFKNKNEAERHQNSLHLRRYSWSCAALVDVEAVFHPVPGRVDVAMCGYCGLEFTDPADWRARSEHVNRVHKFGECNQSKKFFRADHFRQHLKHSHAGASGKWTNMLENACMRGENVRPRPVGVGVGVGTGPATGNHVQPAVGPVAYAPPPPPPPPPRLP